MSTQLSGKDHYLIGVISDTHGNVLESAVNAFKGADLIIHAGDIDTPEALNKIKAIGPHVIVRGNMDYGEWAEHIRESEIVQVGEVTLYVRHIMANTDTIPASADIDGVIFGHTHKPFYKEKNHIVFLNPGSAGQARHHRPLSVALLEINGKSMKARHIQI